jgi:signal transduction histidine kinase
MTWLDVYVLFLAAAATVSAAVAIHALRNWPVVGAGWLAAYAGLITLDTLCFLLQALTPTLDGKVFWLKARANIVLLLPLSLIPLALTAVGRAGQLRPAVWLMLLIEPLLMAGLAATNSWHGWVWRGFWLETFNGIETLTIAYGPGSILNVLYLCALLAVVGLYMLRGLWRTPWAPRWPLTLIVVTASLPLAVSVLQVTGLNPVRPLRLEPFTLVLGVLAWSWGVFRSPLFGVAPVARDTVIEAMDDAVLVLDARGRLVDYNPAARWLLQAAPALGQPAAQALAAYPALVQRLNVEGVSRVDLQVQDEERSFDLRTSALKDRRGRASGRLLILHDFTERARSARIRAATYQVAQAAVTTQTVAEFFSSVHAILDSLFPVPNLFVALVDGERLAFPYFVDEHEAAPEPQPLGRGLTEYVLRTGQPHLVPPDEFDRLVAAGEVESVGPPSVDWMGAPLIAQDAVIGALVVQSYTERVRYELAELEVLAFVASQVSLVVERRQAEDALRARERYLALLNDITRSALQTEALGPMLSAAAERLRELFAADGCYLALWSDADQRTRPAAASGPEAEAFLSLIHSLDDDGALTQLAFEIGRPISLGPDEGLTVGGVPEPLRRIFAAHTALIAPLAAGEARLGLITLTFPRERAVSADDAARGAQVAGQLALALAKTRALEEAERRAQEAETLRRAGAAVAATLHPDEAIVRILDQLAQVVPYDTASIQLMRDGYLEVVGGHGWPDPSLVIGVRFPIPGPNPNTVVVELRQPLILGDVRREADRFPDFELEETAEFTRCWLGVPLIVQDHVIGLLTLDSVQPDYFTPDHARLAVAFADQVAVAMENARLYAALQEQTDELAVLSRASAQLLSARPDPEAVARAVVETVVAELGIELAGASGRVHCGLGVVDESGRQLVGVARAGDHLLPHRLVMAIDGPGLMAAAARSGEAIYAPDVAQDPRYYANHVGTHSELVIPLHAGNRLIGVLNLESPDPDAFGEPARRLLVTFAERAALALENALLLQRLDRARQTAQEANQLKSEFLANTSHELRTPLTGILGSLGLVLDGYSDSPDETRQFLETAHQAAQQLLTMINALLDLSKIEAGKMDLAPEALDIAPVLAEVYGLLHVQAQQKHLALEIQLATDAETRAWADPNKVRQILMNLVGNALKFTDHGKVVVTTRADAARGRLEIAVQDTGIGIDLADQTRLFQPFVQADGSTTRRYGGTGLGLSISQRLAEMMGGELGLYSTGQGQGSTFTLSLPLMMGTLTATGPHHLSPAGARDA